MLMSSWIMPLKGLRIHRSTEDVRHQSGVETSHQDPRHSEQLPRQRSQTPPVSSSLEHGGDTPSTDVLSPALSGSEDVTRPSSGAPPSPPIQEQSSKHKRFSMLKLRYASDPQLSQRAKEHAAAAAAAGPVPPVPDVPSTPAIITTAPTMDQNVAPPKRKTKLKVPGFPRRLGDARPPASPRHRFSFAEPRGKREGVALAPPRDSTTDGPSTSAINLRQPQHRDSTTLPQGPPPPAYGDESNSSLALPISRLSDSSRSDTSSGDHVAYASTTTTTHTVSTTTTFFRLPRRKKHRPLFPLPVKLPPPSSSASPNRSPRLSSSSRVSDSNHRSATPISPPSSVFHPSFEESRSPNSRGSPLASPSQSALAASSSGGFFARAPPLLRQDSKASTRSVRSSPGGPPSSKPSFRERSSTVGSLGHGDSDSFLPTPPGPSSGRTSTSTTGRGSFGALFSFTRVRENSDGHLPRVGSFSGLGPSGTATPKSNSFSLARNPLPIPEREQDDTPAKYLSRLTEAVSRSVVASVCSKSGDEFSQAVLRSYMRSFSFFEDPLDMAIRKLLMEVELPKETQQIDRVLQGFADRYHECNPGVYASPDQAYFIAFSILILHTDIFNKNNKHKMQKSDYLKNTRGEGIADDILECFYDNISYTPFIHVEDDLDVNGERIIPQRPRKALFKTASELSFQKTSREPVDPYALILDNKLGILRPTLKDVMQLEDPYSYLGTAQSLDLANIHRSFFRSGVLQIMSARSRPEAFMSPNTITNPEEAHPGVVDIKVTKVGILWRKDIKKKKARSPWQEWGAILTGSQLYFFRNTAWVKNLIHQHDAHHKQGHSTTPVVFRPPLEHFKPDASMSTDDAVALLDSSYKKHKHAFVFVRHGGFEETFLADTENEMNDWLCKLNYAAAFRTAGVRMRGFVGGHSEMQRNRTVRNVDSTGSTQSIQTPTGEVTVTSGKIDTPLAQQILAARRQIMTQKIKEMDEKLGHICTQLEAQLRNARHLQILAPIQSKTRDQVILSAGRMSAKLKWLRMEIWRLKCHREILYMDLDEERRTLSGMQTRNQLVAHSDLAASALPATLAHVGEEVKPIDGPLSPASKTSASIASPKDSFHSVDEEFETRSNRSQNARTENVAEPATMPRASIEGQAKFPSTISPSRQSLTHRPSISSAHSSHTFSSALEQNAQSPTPVPGRQDDGKDAPAETMVVGPEGTLSNTPGLGAADEKRPDDDGRTSISYDAESPESRSKVRRSLHRTLRDSHLPSHHRSRKGKDPVSGVGPSEDGAPSTEIEGLPRVSGSFTVHGKKASVITFGAEWQNVSPEERLRMRKQSKTDDMRLPSNKTLSDGSDAATLSVRRPSSVRTASTVTTQSAAPAENTFPLAAVDTRHSDAFSRKSHEAVSPRFLAVDFKPHDSPGAEVPTMTDEPQQVDKKILDPPPAELEQICHDPVEPQDEVQVAAEEPRIQSPQPQAVGA
ncbi:hypothetical protein L228DRAFT_155020 [Xylona heveae TC161]|uniref:Protein transport protein sec73 n=1 Tax=Xylona heveae (strain CBS 132557 / TC161) TaxID=1328760 RepID=A0A165FXW3_XYLHT|nr:hypothetical protein L228DRAFT_155020 [Xylona heveae TC161]KZF21516.1 hypothetical protein L228DRAFT_155020 [Xylona heveae TC161]